MPEQMHGCNRVTVASSPGRIHLPCDVAVFRFTLSNRDLERLLAARRVIVFKETIRQWCLKFGKGFDNECLHRQPRQRERHMRRFKSTAHIQRFLFIHGPISNLFRLRHCRMIAADYRTARNHAFITWQEVTCAQNAGYGR